MFRRDASESGAAPAPCEPVRATQPQVRLSVRQRLTHAGWRWLGGHAPGTPLLPAELGPPPSIPPERLRTPGHGEAARQETFRLYRILGNELPPRHAQGQNRCNLDFILRHEPELPGCTKCWVVNRIVDREQEEALLERITAAGHEYLHIPFRWDEYAAIGWDESTDERWPLPGSRLWYRLTPEQAISARLRRYRHKNNYVMNNNGARNAALAHGHTRADWVLPFDGNCFINAPAWQAIGQAIRDFGNARYVVVPMQRLLANEHALTVGGPEQARDEPQLMFRHDAGEWFDEAHPYGRWPKAELLSRLGVPGRWNYWLRKPWDLPITPYAAEAGHFITAGWVMRLFSGESACESGPGRPTRQRSLRRAEAIQRFIDELDAEVDRSTRRPRPPGRRGLRSNAGVMGTAATRGA